MMLLNASAHNLHHTFHKEIAHTLASLPFFSALPDPLRQELAQHARLIDAEKAKILFLQDEPADHLYMVVSGWVKLFRESETGIEAVLDVVSTGRIIGLTGLANTFQHTESAEIVETAQLVEFQAQRIQQALQSDAAVGKALVDYMADLQTHYKKELEHRVMQNAPQRIACYLLELCLNKQQPEPVHLRLPFDKSVLAGGLGIQPETFSRALGKLKDDLGVEVQGLNITIPSIAKMSEYACSHCTSTFPCKK